MFASADRLTLADYEREGRIAFYAKEVKKLTELRNMEGARSHWEKMREEILLRSPEQVMFLEETRDLR